MGQIKAYSTLWAALYIVAYKCNKLCCLAYCDDACVVIYDPGVLIATLRLTTPAVTLCLAG